MSGPILYSCTGTALRKYRTSTVYRVYLYSLNDVAKMKTVGKIQNLGAAAIDTPGSAQLAACMLVDVP